MKKTEIKKAVREGYAGIARQQGSCCAPANPCCGTGDRVADVSKKIGYCEQDLKTVPEGANLGLGCGNPVALASLKEGETVLDLGSGAGFDCFLAANKVGKKGRVIGVDMTPEMVEKAQQNARKGKYGNVDFRLGEIEKLPVESSTVDAIISNCVINLSPDKKSVFAEAFRVLKPGGRLMVSDIVLLKELPDVIKNSIQAYIGCLSGAMKKQDYLDAIRTAGFEKVGIVGETHFPVEFMLNDPTAKAIIDKVGIRMEKAEEMAGSVVSMKVRAMKPKR